MADTNTSPEGASPVTQSASATPSTPSSAVFTSENSPAPHWVHEAGITAAHNAAKPTEPKTVAAVVTPVTPPVEGAAVATPPAQTPPVTQQPAVDPVAIAKAVADGIRTGNQPQPAGPTDAEIAQQLNIVTVTPEMYKSILGVDAQPEQVAALNSLTQAIAKQAVTISSTLFSKQINDLQASLTPYTTAVQTQEAGKLEARFYEGAPDLVGYKELVRQQYRLAKADGKTFASVEDAGKYLAEQTRSVLKQLGITPTAPAAHGTSPAGKPTPQTRQMTPTAVGGKGSGNGSASTTKATINAVWDN